MAVPLGRDGDISEQIVFQHRTDACIESFTLSEPDIYVNLIVFITRAFNDKVTRWMATYEFVNSRATRALFH